MPGSNVVGIQIDVRENASVVGPRVAQVFEQIGREGEQAGIALQRAFDFSQAETQMERFAEKVDRLYETKFGRQRELQLRYLELRNQALEQRLEGTRGATVQHRLLPTVVRTGTVAAELGETGNVVPAGATVLESLRGMVEKAGLPGKIAATIAAVVGVGGVVIDQLSKVYEAFVPAIMDATAALGDMGKSASENAAAFRTNLDKAAGAATKFGYSIETGVQVMGQLARGGVGAEAIPNVLAYARGYGVAPTALIQAQILASRFRGGENVLGLAAGGVQVQGIGPGRYEEYITALTSAMEDAVQKGVARSFEDISATLNFFARLGPMWQGGVGAQKVFGLGQAVAGATGLQRETDVLLYRAARAEVGKVKGVYDYIDVMQEMEKGMTVGLFQQIYKQMQQLTGGNRAQMIELLRQTFGINYTMAASLFQAGATGGPRLEQLVAKLPPPSAESPELKLIQAQNDLRMVIIRTGESLLNAKAELVSAARDLVVWLSKVAGVNVAAQVQREADRANAEAAAQFGKQYGPAFVSWTQSTAKTGPGSTLIGALADIGIAGVRGSLMSVMGAGAPLKGMSQQEFQAARVAAAGIVETLQSLTPEQIEKLATNKGQLFQIARRVGDKDTWVTPSELPAFLEELRAVTKALAENTQALREPATITVSPTPSSRAGDVILPRGGR